LSQNADSKLEEVALTNEQVGELARSEEKVFERGGLEYLILKQKSAFRPSIFYSALAVAAIFYSMALILVARVIYLLWCLKISDVPHGILLLVVSLCLPPTILVIMAMRSLLEHKHEDKKEENKVEDFSPILKLISEVVKVTSKP
jgi:hypothetical protein